MSCRAISRHYTERVARWQTKERRCAHWQLSVKGERTIGLCLTGLEERFGSLTNSASKSESTTKYVTADVISDLLVFNVDAWPTSTKELVDFGNEKIERLVGWFQPLLQKAGCDVSSIPEE